MATHRPLVLEIVPDGETAQSFSPRRSTPYRGGYIPGVDGLLRGAEVSGRRFARKGDWEYEVLGPDMATGLMLEGQDLG